MPLLDNSYDYAAEKAKLEAKFDDIQSDIDKIQSTVSRENRSLSDGEEQKLIRLKRGLERTYEELEELRAAQRELVRQAATKSGAVVSGDGAERAPGTGPYFHMQRDPFASTGEAESAHEVRSRAKTAVERWDADDTLKESATGTLERLRDLPSEAGSDVKGVSEHIIRFSHPDYVSAFRKYSRDPESYVADFTPNERRIWQAAREHQRAALQTSGAVLPSPMDPTIVLTNDGAVDPMRSAARVDTTASKSKRYITSAGSTFSFDAELSEVSDDTFSEAEPEITTHKAQGFIQASIETWMDQPGFSEEVAKIIADGKARLEADKFINGAGDGSNEPFGIVTELTGGSSEVDAAGEAIVADDVYGLLEALPPRFRMNARWQLELSTRNFIHRLWNPSGSEPRIVEDGRIADLPYLLNSSIDPYSDVDASATATHRLLIVGDWSKYTILDRVGTSVYFLQPGVLQNTSNNLPDGRVGWYAMWRVGAESLVDGAFRMLKLSTTA